MYLEEFSELNEKYPQFFDLYKRFFIERFIYNNSELEGLTKSSFRKDFMFLMLEALKRVLEHNSDRITIQDIVEVGNTVNSLEGISGLRRIEVSAGKYAKFSPAPVSNIYMALYSLLDNYYNVWNVLTPFEREARFHIEFMRIHPFEDGNKRTAKIIMTGNLLKSSCAPVIITEEDTDDYYNYLNNLDYDGFAEFLKQRSKMEMDNLVGLFKLCYDLPMDKTPDFGTTYELNLKKIK